MTMPSVLPSSHVMVPSRTRGWNVSSARASTSTFGNVSSVSPLRAVTFSSQFCVSAAASTPGVSTI